MNSVVENLTKIKNHIEKAGWIKGAWIAVDYNSDIDESPCCLGFAIGHILEKFDPSHIDAWKNRTETVYIVNAIRHWRDFHAPSSVYDSLILFLGEDLTNIIFRFNDNSFVTRENIDWVLDRAIELAEENYNG